MVLDEADRAHADYRGRVPMAWVVGESPESCSAYVVIDPSRPFGALQGPDDVHLTEAIAWARRHADAIQVRVGDDTHRYEARVEDEPREPREPPPIESDTIRPPREHETTLWRVEARTGRYRDDRRDVAIGLTSGVEQQLSVTDVGFSERDRGFSVHFALSAPSELIAHERAFAVLRSAWIACGVTAEAVEEFDLDGVAITRP